MARKRRRKKILPGFERLKQTFTRRIISIGYADSIAKTDKSGKIFRLFRNLNLPTLPILSTFVKKSDISPTEKPFESVIGSRRNSTLEFYNRTPYGVGRPCSGRTSGMIRRRVQLMEKNDVKTQTTQNKEQISSRSNGSKYKTERHCDRSV